ncbi:oligosaccharide flippase family protein [Mucilaginibacter ginsenosidivorax]|uniref:Oligosaccharide flippase family protein n=1 Tax=Mucilaginibacter ginsenosidivorax TaxID=862126 RepID=A0A5B8WB16_9SPHI|nr:oligosaccharide flippase family protein [Mucilaginibacter ginsenosidivorax]QEC80065.1 oligosaccharide flippase family protein [Mucilaginibacter ginsenosidivorax]
MKKKLVIDLSANTLQLVINQLFGVVIFYVLSVNLDKNSFGQVNLALAVLLSVFNILSFGIDQVIIKKVAHGDDAQTVLSLYAFHVLFTGGLFYGILLLGRAFFIHDNEVYRLILLLGLGKLMIFFSTPLKQVSSGMEQFKSLACMLVVSNVTRGTGLLVLALLHQVSIGTIIWAFIGGDVLELAVSFYLFKRYVRVPVLPAWRKLPYVALLRQSIPQVGVVLITSALARFDWLFIGFMVSAVSLAEYSFAYKIFEISTLPLLAIAPLILPRFTKLFKTGHHRQFDFKLIIRIELVIAAFTALILNMCWNPVVDKLTHGRYGAVNITTIFILSLCLPFMYLNNFLWTIFFAQNRLKMIFQSFLVTFAVNVVGDLVLIPFYKNEGAALAFLLACLVQAVFYLANHKSGLKGSFYTLVICTSCAFFSGLTAKSLFQNTWLATTTAVAFYGLSLLITMQLKRGDKPGITRLLNW